MDVQLQVYQSNILTSDQLIGQVLVPMTTVVPQVRHAIKHPRGAPYTLQGWFELFPLPRSRAKFCPATKDISQTGMDKPVHSLGYVHIRLDLHLHGRISFWAGYAQKPFVKSREEERKRKLKRRVEDLGGLRTLSAISESGRG